MLLIKLNLASVRCGLTVIFLNKKIYVILFHGAYVVALLIGAIVNPSRYNISFNLSALCSLYKSGRKHINQTEMVLQIECLICI